MIGCYTGPKATFLPPTRRCFYFLVPSRIPKVTLKNNQFSSLFPMQKNSEKVIPRPPKNTKNRPSESPINVFGGNLVFAIPYSVFEGFSNLKALILGPLFDHFPTPFWDPLWKSLLALLGPPRCRASLAMSILEHFWDPPGVQNGALERPGAARKVKTGQ